MVTVDEIVIVHQGVNPTKTGSTNTRQVREGVSQNRGKFSAMSDFHWLIRYILTLTWGDSFRTLQCKTRVD